MMMTPASLMAARRPDEAPNYEMAPLEHKNDFNPYQDNGGTCIAVPGADFCVVSTDNRVSKGYTIATRNGSKITKLTERCVITTSGMLADQITLHKVLKNRVARYVHEHRREPTVGAVAQMLSNILYYKRFFPYYTFNMIASIDENGQGKVYGYDAIGSYESIPCGAQGSGSSLVQSILDNQLTKAHQQLASHEPLSEGQMVELCKDVIASATERDIHTGDTNTICTIDSTGIKFQTFELRKD
mmetsp:Transcript_1328/g.1116  ORF Transcript_1328/g.1116 Transcript_1328/m.1116 type:complete len:243 (-) Transcript_1328:100-828(-)